MRWIESVPNFAEGRDPAVVTAIAQAMESVEGVHLLDRTMDYDHHRSVVTMAGPEEAIGEAAFRGVAAAVERIDLSRHAGVHPRMGAADVVPFVPLEGATLEQCARLAARVGERIWNELEVPVFLYEAAARRPEHARLEQTRRRMTAPDIGGPAWHPTAGATCVGARKFLIAFNVNLVTEDVQVAREIARKVRYSSGGLPGVKALGLFLESRNRVQVSMNLTDFEQTPPHVALEAVRGEAARLGVAVTGSELVGLIPQKALEMAGDYDLQIENFRPEMILENRLREAGAETL